MHICDSGRYFGIAYNMNNTYMEDVVDCIAIYDSGNYAYRMRHVFEQRGLYFEVIATPCKVSKTGCGYSLLFPYGYLQQVISLSQTYGCPVREAYKIEVSNGRKNYIRIK